MTREEWLISAVDELRPLFASHAEVPPVRISVGWPGGRGPKNGVVGQCWASHTTEDSNPAIFVSPVVKDPVEVLVTVVHEMVHAAGKHGHRGEFARLAGAVGLMKPWKSTPASPELRATLAALADKLGPFDHAVIKPGDGPAVQTTRMLKLACPDDGYLVRTTAKWLEVGLPSCPCGTTLLPA